MPFATFDDAWLNYACAPLSVPAVTMAPGATSAGRRDSHQPGSHHLSGAKASIYTPSGWSAATTGRFPTSRPVHRSPSTCSSPRRRTPAARRTSTRPSRRRTARFRSSRSPPACPQTPQVGLTVSGSAPARDVVASPYKAGDVLPYTFTVKSTSNVTANAVPVSGTFETGFLPPSAPNCRYNNLAAGASYTCTTAKHVLTAADIGRGYFVPAGELQRHGRRDTVAHQAGPVHGRRRSRSATAWWQEPSQVHATTPIATSPRSRTPPASRCPTNSL